MYISSTFLGGVLIGVAASLLVLVPSLMTMRLDRMALRLAAEQLGLMNKLSSPPTAAARSSSPSDRVLEALDTANRPHATRLLLAQHWARGALCSQPHEAWGPACSALAIAALCASDTEALGDLLRDQVATSGSDPQVANVWRQALGELTSASQGGGMAIEEPEKWPFPLLAAKSRELLASAHAGAEQLVRSASSPPTANS